MVAISFEASIDDRSSSSSSGAHKILRGIHYFAFAFNPASTSRHLRNGPSHGELEPPPITVSSGADLGAGTGGRVIDSFPAKLFLLDRRLYSAP
jgi:hypothetical protein